MVACWGGGFEYPPQILRCLERRDYPYARMVWHGLPLTGVQRGIDALTGAYRLPGDRAMIEVAVAPRAQERKMRGC